MSSLDECGWGKREKSILLLQRYSHGISKYSKFLVKWNSDNQNLGIWIWTMSNLHWRFDNCRTSIGIWTTVALPLEVRQRCRISIIDENPTEFRQQFILLDFSLSIFRKNFDNTYYSCLFFCPISVAEFRNYTSFSVVFLYNSVLKILHVISISTHTHLSIYLRMTQSKFFKCRIRKYL